MSVENRRVIVVTGASRGIGQGICQLFADRGCTVIQVSRQILPGEFARQCDVGDEESVRALFEEVISSFGKVDVLVNNAGVVSRGDIVDLSLEQWDATLRTNLTGAFLCCKHVLAHMRSRQYGKIVNISSIAGRHRSASASVAYTCSKYGLIGLTRQLALSYAKYGININCVCPSQTRTPMLEEAFTSEQLTTLLANIPAGRLAEPEDIAETVFFLSSDRAGYMNGAILDLNGGQL